MDEVLMKAGQWPNVAVLAGSDPKQVMEEYGVKPPSVFAVDEPEPIPAQFGEWVDSQDDDGAVDDPGVDSREKLNEELMDSCLTFANHGGHLRAFSYVSELLDRQAAITERETKLRELYRFEENHREHIRLIEEVNQRLNERIDELTAERDRNEVLAVNVEQWKDERDLWNKRARQAHDYALELTAERDRLRKQRDEAFRAMGAAQDRMEQARDERDQLQKVVKIQAESFQKLERELKEAKDER